MGAINECLAQIESAARNKVIAQCLQNPLQNAVLDPSLEAAKARRVRRVTSRHVRPRRARSMDPQDAVEYIARVAPRATAPVLAHLGFRQQWLDDGPLLIGQVHLDLRSQT